MTRFFLNPVNIRFLAFGFLAAVFSSFGQTFFISLSGGEIRAAFNLSHGDFGLLYAMGTLSSALLLIWLGRKIDDIDLRVFTAFVIIGLGVACMGMAHVIGPITLVCAIFALRLTGQGLMSHIAFVSMGRYFDAHRGKAVSVASVGFPAGEAIFPIIAVAIIATIGWQNMWLALGGVILLVLFPFLMWLLRGHQHRHAALLKDNQSNTDADRLVGWTRAQVMRDPKFYVLIPSVLAMPYIGTGIFFHQVHLVAEKGWGLTMFASFFVIFAVFQMCSAMLSGIAVDRWGAATTVRLFLLPACMGLVILSQSDTLFAGAVFMALFGLSGGAATVTGGAIWAELYGVAHLGAIKALAWALMVFASALSPPMMGIAIDHGFKMDTIALISVAFLLAATVLVITVFPRLNNARPN